VEGERLYLRDVMPGDVGPTYLRWMTDSEVNRFLESRWSTHTLESLAAFVEGQRRDPRSAFFAIMQKDGDRHVGNIKIGDIDWHHRRGDVGLLLGEKDTWGRGYAAEAIGLATRFGFEALRLHKLTAGCYAPNEGSRRAFLKAGWTEEGRRREAARLDDGSYVDLVLLGITEDEWRQAARG
jgi:[ribosomal protein S5]-alanine N-acetyltransferase